MMESARQGVWMFPTCCPNTSGFSVRMCPKYAAYGYQLHGSDHVADLASVLLEARYMKSQYLNYEESIFRRFRMGEMKFTCICVKLEV